MGDFWLVLKDDETNYMRTWGGSKNVEEAHRFKIECTKDNNYLLSCGGEFQWKFAVNKHNHSVGFVKEQNLNKDTFITDLNIVMIMKFGEDAFQLHITYHDKNDITNQLKFDPGQQKVILHDARDISEETVVGLQSGTKYFTFILGKKW